MLTEVPESEWRTTARPRQFRLLTLLGAVSLCATGLAWYASLRTGLPQRAVVLGAPVCGGLLALYLRCRLRNRVLLGIILSTALIYLGIPLSRAAKYLAAGRYVEYRGLSGPEFVLFVGYGDLRPWRASQISIASGTYIDGYDFFLKMHVPEPSYRALLAQRSQQLRELDSADLAAGARLEVRKTSATAPPPVPKNWPVPLTPALPNNWPIPDAPGWWDAATASTTAERNCWELQSSWQSAAPGALDVNRSLGWYWAYDNASQTLWIWEWNHQHHDLGWPRP